MGCSSAMKERLFLGQLYVLFGTYIPVSYYIFYMDVIRGDKEKFLQLFSLVYDFIIAVYLGFQSMKQHTTNCTFSDLCLPRILDIYFYGFEKIISFELKIKNKILFEFFSESSLEKR